MPGLEAQMKMAPITRRKELSRMISTDAARQSAVLILFYLHQNETHLALIKRATDHTVHSAQVSFPGGKMEESDKNLEETALRESWEEVGLKPDEVEVIGQLSKLHIPPSNFDVYPYIAYTTNRPDFKINHEVARLLEVPWKQLKDPACRVEKEIKTRNNISMSVPCFFIQEEVVWGATAMMISELIDIAT